MRDALIVLDIIVNVVAVFIFTAVAAFCVWAAWTLNKWGKGSGN